MATKPLCSIPDCGKQSISRGWCPMHYRRNSLFGDPLKLARDPKAPLRHLEDVVLIYAGDECLLWPFNRVKYGYGRVSIEGKPSYVHRLVCEAANGAPPTPEHEAAHSCGNGHLGCVTRKHLRWATVAENAQDKLAHGTSSRGTQNPRAILNETTVREIRALKGLETQRETAKRFGVSHQTVSLILNGGVWGWVD